MTSNLSTPLQGKTEGWDADRIERAKAMYLSGQTASEIAGALGGLTRSAVCGKLWRLGMKREGPAAPTARKMARIAAMPPKPAKVTKPRRVPSVPAEGERLEALVIARKARSVAVASNGNTYALSVCQPIAPVRVIPQLVEPKGLLELEPRECRYPVNDGQDPARGFLFCASPAVADKPYCAGHQHIVVNKALTERKRRRCNLPQFQQGRVFA